MIPFSVITINFNSGKTIRRTIDSVLEQKRDLFQYIVIDGRSTDESYEIIEEKKLEIDILVSEPDGGIYDAMNKGLELAKGRYLVFLNAGDVFYSSKVLEQVHKTYNPACAIMTGKVEMKEDKNSYIYAVDYVDAFALSVHTLPHPSTFVRYDVFQRVGNFRASFRIAGDYDFFVNAVHKHKYKVDRINEVISTFYKDGISANNQDLLYQERKKIHKEHYGSLVPLYRLVHTFRMKMVRIKRLWIFMIYPSIYKTIKKLYA